MKDNPLEIFKKNRQILVFLDKWSETWKKVHETLRKIELFDKKKSSKFEPDFCPIKLDSDPWIVQPTEHYEELSIEDVMKKN